MLIYMSASLSVSVETRGGRTQINVIIAIVIVFFHHSSVTCVYLEILNKVFLFASNRCCLFLSL